jgi:SWI/SNF-related matrix-associated actin-dependent regulator of chromatin subfamily A3
MLWIVTYFRRPDDQQKVRRAIATQHVDPADIPASAKVVAAPVATVTEPHAPSQSGQASIQAVGQKKRKLALESSGTSSQLSAPRASAAPVGARRLTSSALHDEDDEVMIIEPEPVDELYCVTSASIVGVQYYKGGFYLQPLTTFVLT